MALTASQITTRIQEIEAALHTGAVRVKHGDTETEYRSLRAMRSIITNLEGKLAALTTPNRRIHYPYQSTKAL